jgi:hypothetical protein
MGLILALAAATAFGQPGGGGPGGRGGFGGMGGMMRAGGAMILGMPDVQKELSVTDDQKTKLTELQQTAMEDFRTMDFSKVRGMSQEERTKFFSDIAKKSEEKIGKILDAKQMERLKQLQVQMQGVQALTDPDVVAKLKLSQDAQDKIKKVIDDSRQQRPQGNFFNMSDEERKAAMDKMQEQRAATMKSALAVLDDDQLLEWGKMTGKEFKFDLGQFGRGGFGGRGNRGGQGGGPGGPGGQNNQGGAQTPPPKTE